MKESQNKNIAKKEEKYIVKNELSVYLIASVYLLIYFIVIEINYYVIIKKPFPSYKCLFTTSKKVYGV